MEYSSKLYDELQQQKLAIASYTSNSSASSLNLAAAAGAAAATHQSTTGSGLLHLFSNPTLLSSMKQSDEYEQYMNEILPMSAAAAAAQLTTTNNHMHEIEYGIRSPNLNLSTNFVPWPVEDHVHLMNDQNINVCRNNNQIFSAAAAAAASSSSSSSSSRSAAANIDRYMLDSVITSSSSSSSSNSDSYFITNYFSTPSCHHPVHHHHSSKEKGICGRKRVCSSRHQSDGDAAVPVPLPNNNNNNNNKRAAPAQYSSCPPLPKVVKEKIGDRIAALHRLVAPFGKTDAASVLSEALGYIHFLHHQIQTLSMYCINSSQTNTLRCSQQAWSKAQKQKGKGKDKAFCWDDAIAIGIGSGKQQGEAAHHLKSRGLSVVPISLAAYLSSYPHTPTF